MSLNKYETYKKAVEELVGSYDSTLLEAVKDIGNIVDSYAIEKEINQKPKMTVEEFNRLSYKEKVALYNSDYETYKKLAEGGGQ